MMKSSLYLLDPFSAGYCQLIEKRAKNRKRMMDQILFEGSSVGVCSYIWKPASDTQGQKNEGIIRRTQARKKAKRFKKKETWTPARP